MSHATSIGFRLAAARITSGIAVRLDAAETLGVSQYALMRYEVGSSNPDRTLLDKASSLYGVSKDFLEDGYVGSDRDQISARIALLLASVDDGETIDPEMAVRLKMARVECGFATAAAAARKLDFAKATYLAHENGGRRLPVEKAIYYSLKLKVRPEFILKGEGAIRVAVNDPLATWSPITINKAEFVPKDWHWLGARGERGQLNLPLISEDGRVFSRLGKDTISMPEAVIPKDLKSLTRPLYAMPSSDEEIWVLDPANTVGDIAVMGKAGLEIVKSNHQQSLPDILTLPPGTVSGVMLGLIVARISIKSAA